MTDPMSLRRAIPLVLVQTVFQRKNFELFGGDAGNRRLGFFFRRRWVKDYPTGMQTAPLDPPGEMVFVLATDVAERDQKDEGPRHAIRRARSK